MLVSVIITCYNLEKYIGEALESVISQDFDPSKYEIIVVDDCSTDRSAEIIKSYINVCYIRSEKNLGVLMATVLGLEHSNGELVFFLDGDDVWESAKLSATVGLFEADFNLAFVTHDLSYVDSCGHTLVRRSKVEMVMESVSSSEVGIVTREGILLHKDYVWLGSAYAVRRAQGNLRGFCTFARGLPDPFNTYQDWPLAFWVACQPQVSCGYLNRKLFRYRLHGLNHSGDATSVTKAVRNVRRTCNTMYAINDIANRFCDDVRVRRATNRKLAFSVYLVHLYSGQRLSAAKGLFLSLPYLITGAVSFWKEIVRFLVVQFVGIESFVGFVASRDSSM